MDGNQKITVVLADEHAIVLEGFTATFRHKPEISVVGQCSDGQSALDSILALQPDFAVIGLLMPRLAGVEVVRRVRQAGSGTKLIVLSIVRDEAVIRELFRSGMDGYLLKEGPARQIFDAMSRISAGDRYLTPLLRRSEAQSAAARKDPMALLSKRELQVFSLLVDGVRPRDIAKTLEISPKTVDTYRANIMRKLEVDGIPGLVRFAVGGSLNATGHAC